MAELKMTQKQLSSMTGIAESSLCRYLEGTEPRIDIVLNVANALGVEPSYFFTKEEIKQIDPYEQSVQIIGRNKNVLSDEQKTALIKIILSK